jgi:hypothetical protein
VTEIDLSDRLRSAAESLAADFSDEISAERAETLVFRSAEGLLAAASLTEFVPILAERRARLAMRSETPAAAPVPAPVDAVETADPADVPPLLALPERDLARLRNDIDRLRLRVAGWQAEVAHRT